MSLGQGSDSLLKLVFSLLVRFPISATAVNSFQPLISAEEASEVPKHQTMVNLQGCAGY